MSPPKIRIALPFPKAIDSHNKGHWRAKAGPIKAMRELASLIARQKVAEHGKLQGPFQMAYEIHVPDLRRRDTVNILQQCKPYLDGVVDSGLIEGDHWAICQLSEVSVFHCKGISAVVLEFWK